MGPPPRSRAGPSGQSPPRAGLAPRIHPLARSFLAREDLVAKLVDRHGSPLHVVFPEIFAENVASFRQVLQATGLGYQICYAHKVNQAAAFVRAARDEGIGIDVASPGELGSATAAGIPPDRVEATGPKGRRFLEALAGTGVTVNADNPWEVSEVIRLARDHGSAAVPVLVRLSGFGGSPGRAPRRASRFGVAADCFGPVLSLLRSAPDAVAFRGLSFHLDSSETREKLQAMDECLNLFEQCWAAGLTPRVLDIGGGFRQAFIDDPAAFERYAEAFRAGLADGSPLTWDDNLLGYQRDNGKIHGVPVFHKYANDAPGSSFLRELLSSPLPGQSGRPAAQVLRENMIELWIEPGKSLVDHAGLTLASVEFVKPAADGNLLVNLDISRDKLCPADQEVMLDPVLIYRSPAGTGPTRPGTGVFFAGNLCLERDMVFNHLTFLARVPEPGDIVAFVNTAGYQMDLSAASAQMYRRPARIVVRSSQAAGFTADLDHRG